MGYIEGIRVDSIQVVGMANFLDLEAGVHDMKTTDSRTDFISMEILLRTCLEPAVKNYGDLVVDLSLIDIWVHENPDLRVHGGCRVRGNTGGYVFRKTGTEGVVSGTIDRKREIGVGGWRT